jgi:hypothetical protein
MGLFGQSKNLTIDLARVLLRRRISEDLNAKARGFTPSMADRITADQLAGLAETTVSQIVESVAKLTLTNYDEEASIRRVEQHRRQIGYGPLPSPLTMHSYVAYRIAIEYPDHVFPDGHIEWCTNAAIHLFQYIDDKSDISHAIKFADKQFTTAYLAKFMDAIEDVMDSGDESGPSMDFISDEIHKWKLKKEEIRQKRANFELRATLRNM